MSKLRIPVSEGDHQTGNTHSDVVLIEYGDYQCPHCGRAHPLIKKLLKEFGQDINFVFRNFPIQESHPMAMLAAQTAEASSLQNKFWEMHDYIYENQNKLSSTFLQRSATVQQLNEQQFSVDSQSDAVVAKIEQDFDGGVRSGVNGTPSFFLNGQKINTYDETYESLAELIRSVK